MRFLHTSDWHLGRRLHGHDLLDDQAFVLDEIVSLVRQHDVDVLLLAGDVYDRSIPPDGAVALFNRTITRLIVDAGAQVVVIPGNHDSALRLGFGASLLAPQGLHLRTDLTASDEPLRLAAAGLEVAIYALPFATPEAVRAAFDAPEVNSAESAMAYLIGRVRQQRSRDQFNILLSHCFVAGGEASDSERPLSVGGSDQVSLSHFDGFDYVALGHLHRPNRHGAEHLRYSGSPLKYSVSEASHDKSVVLFDATAAGLTRLKVLPLSRRRDVRKLIGSLDEILARGADDAQYEDYVQIELTDQRPLHDVHGRLAAFYPNRLQVYRQQIEADGAAVRDGIQTLPASKGGEATVFADFFEQSAGRSLTAAERALVERTLDALS